MSELESINIKTPKSKKWLKYLSKHVIDINFPTEEEKAIEHPHEMPMVCSPYVPVVEGMFGKFIPKKQVEWKEVKVKEKKVKVDHDEHVSDTKLAKSLYKLSSQVRKHDTLEGGPGLDKKISNKVHEVLEIKHKLKVLEDKHDIFKNRGYDSEHLLPVKKRINDLKRLLYSKIEVVFRLIANEFDKVEQRKKIAEKLMKDSKQKKKEEALAGDLDPKTGKKIVKKKAPKKKRAKKKVAKKTRSAKPRKKRKVKPKPVDPETVKPRFSAM